MKAFFSKYSYSIIKMFVNQCAISIFGSVLAMATASAGNDILTLVVSCFAILFYLFLIYTMVWEVGAKDKISVDVGKKTYRPHTGVFMALIANIPNFLIAIVYTSVYSTMGTVAFSANTAAVTRIISVLIQGMYLGTITTVSAAGKYLNHFWWTYFLITIPSIVTAWVAYIAGHKNFRVFAALRKNQNDGIK